MWQRPQCQRMMTCRSLLTLGGTMLQDARSRAPRRQDSALPEDDGQPWARMN